MGPQQQAPLRFLLQTLLHDVGAEVADAVTRPGSAVDRLVAVLREQFGVLAARANTTQPLVANTAGALDAGSPRPQRAVPSQGAADGPPGPVHATRAAPAVVGALLPSALALR